MLFTNGKLHEIKDVTLHVTLKSGILEFVESITLCEIDETDFNLRDTFIKIHTVDIKYIQLWFVVYYDGK